IAGEEAAWQDETPSWGAAPEPPVEPERPAVKTNGSGPHQEYSAETSAPAASPLAASSTTLEDSVKDMLRPMLRQWLDENMARVLTAALKDELKTDEAPRPQD